MKFDIMDKEKKVSHVEIEGNKVMIERFFTSPLYPFGTDGMTVKMEHIATFFASRCFEESRPDKEELLKGLGLETYNPLDIIKVTEGRMAHDTLWIRFEE